MWQTRLHLCYTTHGAELLCRLCRVAASLTHARPRFPMAPFRAGRKAADDLSDEAGRIRPAWIHDTVKDFGGEGDRGPLNREAFYSKPSGIGCGHFQNGRADLSLSQKSYGRGIGMIR